MSGIGGGFANTLNFLTVADCFDKHLGAANGFVIVCGAVGRIILPQIAVYLQYEYGFTGATLITGYFFSII